MTPHVPCPVLRFAPSPNGELHLGHALSALIGFEMAHRLGGRFLVRIEDIDVARVRPAYIAQIFSDLAWLGLTWEEPVLRQSQHFPFYAQAARRLRDVGLLYPCFATRAEIALASRAEPDAIDPDGVPLYPGLHRHLNASEVADRTARGEPFALRLDMARAMAAAGSALGGRPLTFEEITADGAIEVVEAKPERWGDVVIVRKDVPTTYHLAVVLDDARQGVTHVTRGRDLYAATDLHRLLQVLLGLAEPIYSHHRLITDAAGRKLAKSARDTSLRSLREAGRTPVEVRRLIGLG
jgi:glutamyl-Q tRNA(Asp) synthetase